MRKLRIITVLFLSLFLLSTMVGHAGSDSHEVLDSMEVAAENEYLVLYLNPKTSEIAVYDKETEQIWFSNPYDWENLEKAARGTAKEQLGAQFIITYDRPDRRNREANNYSESIALNLFEVVEIDNGIRVEYSLGRKWADEDYLPLMIEQTRFEELVLNHLPSSAVRNFTQRYHLVCLKEYAEGARLELQGMNMDRLLGDYEFVVMDDRSANLETQIQEVRASLSRAADDEKEDLESQLVRLEGQLNSHRSQILWDLLDMVVKNNGNLESLDQVQLSHLEQLVDTPTYVLGRVPVFARTALIEAIKTTDYGPDQASQDRVANNLDPIQENIETFFVPLEYRLEGKSLVAHIPVGEIEYPLNVLDNQGKSHTYPLHTISLLPYLGAAHEGQDGYIFIPDGSGALIHLNSPSYTLGYLGNPIYGRDLTGDNSPQLLINPQQTYMPVYGMKVEDTAFLAIIEQGEALARINANKAGFANSFHSVFPRFNVMPMTNLSLGPIGDVNVYQKRIYQGDIQVRYYFLTGADADYVGMAKAYQEYLVEKYELKPIDGEEPLPFYLSIVGNIVRNEPVVGIPRERVRSLTTFKQTEEIVAQLLAGNVGSIKVRYRGWLQGGPEHLFPTAVQFEKSAGGESEFVELTNWLEKKGVEFFPQVDFLIVHKNTVLDDFSPRKDGAQFFNNRPKRLRTYDIAFGVGEDTESYILSPRSLGRVIESFLESYSQYGVKGLAFNDLGKYVNSDFRNKPEEVTDRQQSAQLIEEQMALVESEGWEIMVEGGNALVYPYVKHIVGVPFENSQHEIFDEWVPFYQLALHGYMNYSGRPLNLAADYKKTLLQSISVGAGLHFQWAFENTHLINNSRYNSLYALNYSDWIDQAVQDYERANTILEHVRGAEIVDYFKLTDDWHITVYDNGFSIGVDYAKSSVTVYERGAAPVVFEF